jgi:hypothetical protein
MLFYEKWTRSFELETVLQRTYATSGPDGSKTAGGEQEQFLNRRQQFGFPLASLPRFWPTPPYSADYTTILNDHELFHNV